MPASASVRRGWGMPGPLARAGVAAATWLIARLLPRHRPGRDRGWMLTGPNLEHWPRADKRLILSPQVMKTHAMPSAPPRHRPLPPLNAVRAPCRSRAAVIPATGAATALRPRAPRPPFLAPAPDLGRA